MGAVAVKGLVSGRVQGVWFRRFVQQAATAESVTGFAKNLPDGRVEVLLCGDEKAVSAVQAQVAIGPPAAQVQEVIWKESFERVGGGFDVR